MRRKYVQIVESGRVFNSLSACDNFLGSEGLTSTILKLPDNFHTRYNIHIVEVDKTTYENNVDNDSDQFKNVVNTYQIPCRWCGELFHPVNVHQFYCTGKHYQTCKVCGYKFDVTHLLSENKDVPSTCSYECTIQSRKNTIAKNQEDPEYEVRKAEKRAKTCLETYGYDNVAKVPEIKQRSVSTFQEKYGVDNPGKLPQAQEAIHAYWDDQERLHLATLKREETNRNLFGSNYITQTVENRIKQGMSEEQATRLAKFYEDPECYIQNVFDYQPTTYDIYLHFGSYEPLTKLKGSNLIKWNVSIMEQEVTNFLLSLDPNMAIYHNCRTKISPLELDLYLEEYNVAIECNPTFTHNSSKGAFDDTILPYTYHYKKTVLCEETGIFLFHIFGYEWTHKRKIIESMLQNLLGFNTSKIYARKCEIQEVPTIECKRFLTDNHRQGYTTSQINLGLYYENQLVSLMTFGRLRSTMGLDSTDLSNCWELVRFCNLQGTSVIGGASKLFKHFIKTYNPERIRSFSDRTHTRGNMYSTLGFNKIRESGPNYVWVNEKTDIAYHRANAQKRNLKKFLHDDSIDLTKTEKEIMIEHGYVQVFDAGTITWEWNSNR